MNKIINWGFAGLILAISAYGLAFGYQDTLFVTVYWVRLSPAETAALEQVIQVLAINGRYWLAPYSGLWVRKGQGTLGGAYGG